MTAIPGRTPSRAAARRVLLLASLILLWAPAAAGGDEPFTFPSNMGFTGLMETPTARLMKENRYRVGVTQFHPYRSYFGTVGIFERLEVNGRITEVLDARVAENVSIPKNPKDKAVDIKIRILAEGKYAPAVTLAVLDPHGTRLFPSQALVASKQVFPFDFSIGLGNGRFGKGALPREGGEFGLELFTDPKGWWTDALLRSLLPPSHLLVLWLALLCAVPGPSPIHANASETAIEEILSAAESLFKSLKARDDPGTWKRLTAKSRDTIVDETLDAIRKSGEREVTKEEVRRNFEAGGPLAKGYWNGFLEHFNPDAALEQSRWEMGTIGTDRAEVLILSKGSEKPAVVKLFKEEGSWKVGLVESFWGRR